MKTTIALLLLSSLHVCVTHGNERPNFIVILADDLGYGDLGCFGSADVATPELDRMAKEGMRFTNFYSAAPFCSPSRAALLTGRLPARCGVPYVLFPAEHHGLPAAEVTIAELLKEQGYATAIVGKWHLGWDIAFRPLKHGFDEFFGLPYSNDSNEWPVGEGFMQVHGLEPQPLINGDRIVEAPVHQATLTKRYTQRSGQFIEKNKDKPFLLYLSHTMPHIPQFASSTFEGKSKGGLYGDAIEELDWSIGEIRATLQRLGLSHKTLIIFTSDNGAVVRNVAMRQLATSTVASQGRFPGRSLGGSNGKLRTGKGTTWEGGIRVPAIACWPSRVKGDQTIDQCISMMDLFPTFARLAGAQLPAGRTYDGRDLSDVLFSEKHDETDRLFVHYFGYQLQAVRQGRWKLNLEVKQRPDPRPVSLWWDHQPQLFDRQHRLLSHPELYDLENDIGETTNLEMTNPDVVDHLTKRARDYDAKLKTDMRPMEFVSGPLPPAPQQIRKPNEELSAWQRRM